jgi:HD-GYP domain-containing protein (c-di-GMP phosphodiesterase class II)
LEGFQRDKKKVIKALKHVKGNVTCLEGTKYVVRGLENYQTLEFNRTIRNQRRAVLKRVLQVQREQQQTMQRGIMIMGATCRSPTNAVSTTTPPTTTTTIMTQLQQHFNRESGTGEEQQHDYQHHQQDVQEVIANASRQESAWARELAYRMGLRDEETVRLGWQEFFADVAMIDGDVSSSDSETSLVSVQDLSSSCNHKNGMVFDHPMYFDHPTKCMVDNTTSCVA